MITVNEIEYCKVSVQYEAESDLVLDKKNEIVQKFKNHKVPGFRPGYVPNDVAKKFFKKEINEALKQELAQEAFTNTLTEKNFKPFGRPQFSSITLEEPLIGDIPKFRCEFSLHIQPEFNLDKYKEFEIPKASGFLSTEELSQRMLQDLRMKNGKTIQYGPDDFVQMEDNIILDLKGTLDGEVIEKYNGTGEILNVGHINIPGFSENLLGMKCDESREFDLTMPETFETYPNKTIHFEVKISNGSKIIPAALDDELAKLIGVETFDKLVEVIKSTASNRVKEFESNFTWDQIAQRLIENHNFEIPSWISTAEAQINAKNNGVDFASASEEDRVKYIDMAAKSIKLSLILQKIRENEPDAQLTDEETIQIARQNLAKYSQDPNKTLQELYANGHLSLLVNRIRDEHTLNFIQKTCKILE